MSNRELLERINKYLLSHTPSDFPLTVENHQLIVLVQAELSKPLHISKGQIREIFLANGFTIKKGQEDLKPYVYEAAYALLNIAKLSQSETIYTDNSKVNAMLEEIIVETAKELGCKPDNEEILKSIHELKSKLAETEKGYTSLDHENQKLGMQITYLKHKLAKAEKDAKRFEWVLPILGGVEDSEADKRALILATSFLKTDDVRLIIDLAISNNIKELG